jgi:hypothetical protein
MKEMAAQQAAMAILSIFACLKTNFSSEYKTNNAPATLCVSRILASTVET